MKHKLIFIIASAIIVMTVGCGPTSPTSTPRIETTPRADVPATATPTTQPTPMETATAARTAVLTAPSPRTTVPTLPSPRTLVPIVSPIPTQGGGRDVNGTPAPFDSEAERIVLLAKQDLAKRLAITVDQISLVEVQSVTWSDGSLGCPQPGMMYTQALVDGYLIRLNARGQMYEYHGGGNRPPFLCQSKP